nr:immunoglobulin heavy chain junction region [Mus musculus]MBK4196973.1 immunoglobulin heavy chain junction region [Mus musculus]
CARPDGGFAYW